LLLSLEEITIKETAKRSFNESQGKVSLEQKVILRSSKSDKIVREKLYGTGEKSASEKHVRKETYATG